MDIHVEAGEVNRLAVDLDVAAGAVGADVATAIRRSAFAVERDAKAFAPVDTGNLRNSISTDITGDGRFGEMSAEIGPTADYGHYVEHGTSTQAPQAYLGPAFDRQAPGFVEALEQLLVDGLGL